mmetsp:Transcript_21875/g.30468  ORF Transcript_21875/g.30468 Transcript_21875/m.30468 type:complete len:242 (+) Transcript_21875:138-863(+)
MEGRTLLPSEEFKSRYILALEIDAEASNDVRTSCARFVTFEMVVLGVVVSSTRIFTSTLTNNVSSKCTVTPSTLETSGCFFKISSRTQDSTSEAETCALVASNNGQKITSGGLLACTSASMTPLVSSRIRDLIRSSIARAAEDAKSLSILTSTSTMALDPTCLARTRVTSRTSSVLAANLVTFRTKSSLLVSVNCLMDSLIISAPVMQIIPATINPAAESAANSPGTNMARPIDTNAKIDE